MSKREILLRLASEQGQSPWIVSEILNLLARMSHEAGRRGR